MLRLCKINPDFNYADYSLDAIASNGKEEPGRVPLSQKKKPIRLVSMVQKVESQLLDLLLRPRDESMNVDRSYGGKKGGKERHVCTKCGKGYLDTNGFRQNIWIKHSLMHVPINHFHCNKCDFKCQTETDMREHLYETHDYLDRKIPSDCTHFDYTKTEMKEIEKIARVCFPEWGSSAPKVKSLDFLKRSDRVVRTVARKGIVESCELCGDEVQATKQKLYRAKEEHVATVHHPLNLWKCNQCTFGSPTAEKVISHFKKEHKAIKFNEDIHVKPAGHPERKKFTREVLKSFPNTTIPILLK